MIAGRASQERLGVIGTIVGLVALGVAIFHFFLGPIEPPPSLGAVVAEVASDVKEALAAKLQGRENAPERQALDFGPDRIVDIAVIVLGFIALALGVVGFVKREEWRPSGTAIALGSAAMAFQFAIAIVADIIAAIIHVHIMGYEDIY
jgi:hypothetical protein